MLASIGNAALAPSPPLHRDADDCIDHDGFEDFVTTQYWPVV